MITKIITMRWNDGYSKEFKGVEVSHSGPLLLNIDLPDGSRRIIPTAAIRWFTIDYEGEDDEQEAPND